MVSAQNLAQAVAGTPTESALTHFSNHEHLLRALFDDAPHGVFITRPDGRIAVCNRYAWELLGCSREDIVDHHFNEFTHPEDQAIGVDAIRAIMAGHLSSSTVEKRYVNRNGEILWIHLSIGVIRNDQGAVDYFVTTLQDITKERRQSFALLESEQRLAGLVDAIPYALLCVNVDGMCVYYKPARDHIHAASDALVGKKLNEFLPNDAAQTLLDTALAVLSKNQAFNVEFQIPNDSGERHYEAHVAPFGASETIMLVLDVTDRVESERHREQAQAAIIEGQREILRQISTPLMPIADGVIAMPLVGPVDRERAQQMLSALMEGVTSHGARTVIIDITGVPNVDAEVAELLARVTQVVKLLGAEALFAGIRPDVARNIIALGVDLTSFRSAGSFQSAIAVALQRNRVR